MKKTGKNKKKRRSEELTNTVLLIITASVFVFSLVKVFTLLVPYYTGGHVYEEIKKQAIIRDAHEVHIHPMNSKNPGSEQKVREEPTFAVDFDLLHAENPDTVGWIRFEEPKIISYPIVKSADNVEYLTKTFTANDNKLGAIFMDKDNSSDFSDTNTIIYGHNMKVGNQMFSRIRDYSSEDFCKNYPYFYIYLPGNREMRYRIFSAGVVKDSAQNYQISFSSDTDVEAFIRLCRNSSNYPVDVEVNAKSKIVTLSTCTCVKEDERFIVQGVLEE